MEPGSDPVGSAVARVRPPALLLLALAAIALVILLRGGGLGPAPVASSSERVTPKQPSIWPGWPVCPKAGCCVRS